MCPGLSVSSFLDLSPLHYAFLGGFLLGNQMSATGSRASCFQIHVLQEKIKFSEAGTKVLRLNFLGSDWPVYPEAWREAR